MELEKRSQSGEYWGLWAGIDLHACDPGFVRSEQKIKEFVVKLCDRIKMKRFGETVVVNFGDDEKVAGFSMVQLIETSSITGHFVNQTNNIFLDVFSCSIFDPQEVADFAKDFFKAKDYELNFKVRK